MSGVTTLALYLSSLTHDSTIILGLFVIRRQRRRCISVALEHLFGTG